MRKLKQNNFSPNRFFAQDSTLRQNQQFQRRKANIFLKIKKIIF